MKIIFTFLFLFLLLQSCEKSKDNEGLPTPPALELQSEILAQSLQHPWEIVYGPDEMIWLTERSGKISRLNPNNGVVSLLHTIPEVNSIGEGGLLGMVLHPNFESNPYVYVVYDYGSGNNYQGKVVRFSYKNSTLSDPKILLDHIPAAANHNGSRLLITADEKLLITTGDAGVPSNAQQNNSLSGKILRINLDGSIPADNPFPGNAVWSTGHRNAQGLALTNDKLYSSEHGPDTDDEINLIRKGMNYGWPDVTGFCNTSQEKVFCTSEAIVEPLYTWTPTIAPSGLIYYHHDLIPQWKNSLLVVALKGTSMLQLKLDDTGTRIESVKSYFQGEFGRLRAICQSPDGKVYLATSNGNRDMVIRVSPL